MRSLLLVLGCLAYYNPVEPFNLCIHKELSSPALPTSDMVFQSTDGGETWKDISAGLPKNFQTNCLYANEHELLLGYEWGVYRRSSTSSGWQHDPKLNENIGLFFQGKEGPVAFSYDGGFYQGVSGRDIWVQQDIVLEDRSLWAAMEAPDGNLLVSCESGIYKSSADRKTWRRVLDQGMVNNLVTHDGEIFGSGFKGVAHSSDNGAHWKWTFSDHGRAMQMLSFHSGIAVVFWGIDGPWQKVSPEGQSHTAFISNNHGQSWNRVDEGLPAVRNILDFALVENILFCSMDTGLYRSKDLGKTWERVIGTAENTYFKLTVAGKNIFAVKVSKGC